MDNRGKISVIVPVYNAEKYLSKCIESILAQTYQNIEIILVNDGSKDNSLQVCNDYAILDNRIIVINQENGGPSKARNSGIDAATGQYLGFVDSDDTINKNMYELLLKNMLETESQISMIGMQYCFINGKKRVYYEAGEKRVIFQKEMMDIFWKNRIITFAPVDKLYSREAIGEIRFDTQIKMCEDQKFVYQVMKNVNKSVYDPSIGYNIFCTEGSLSRSKPTRYHLSILDVNEYIINDITDENQKIQAMLYNVNCCLTFFVVNYKNGEFLEEDINRIDNIIKKNSLLVLKKGDIKLKIKLFLYYFSKKLLGILIDSKNKAE